MARNAHEVDLLAVGLGGQRLFFVSMCLVLFLSFTREDDDKCTFRGGASARLANPTRARAGRWDIV